MPHSIFARVAPETRQQRREAIVTRRCPPGVRAETLALIETVRAEVRQLIKSGELTPGSYLPLLNDLAVSTKTIRHSLLQPVEDGLIELRRPYGYRVRDTAAIAIAKAELDRGLQERLLRKA